MGQATLMFGMGATKAGSSWLYRYLSNHPECKMSDPKELHYFDRLENNKIERAVKKLDQRIDAIGKVLRENEDLKLWRKRRHRRNLMEWRKVLTENGENTDAYLRFLYRDADRARLVGEITPSYSLLPESRMQQMANLPVKTLFVYVLRDPVERLWSNVRMIADRRAGSPERVKRVAHRLITKVIEGTEVDATKRSDYANSLKKMDAALPKGSLLVEFFERLFSEEALTKLCRFLGIYYRPGDLTGYVHKGIEIPLEDDARNALQRVLAPQYAFVEQRFGSLPEGWKQNMVKV